MAERDARAMAAIGGTVSLAMATSPRTFLRLFGIPAEDVTGAAALGWRLFAVRTAYLSAQAAGGDRSAREAFLPIQIGDQAVFWHAFAQRSVPRSAPVLAATVSAAIIALDRRRRRPVT